MCDFLDKDIKFPRFSCLLNCCSECPGLFVPDAEINGDKYVDLQFIRFNHYENISSCSLHKQLLPDHGKTCPFCTNTENVEKEKVTTWKILVLSSCSILDFHSEYYIPEIKILAFHLPHVYILGVNHCAGKKHAIFASKRNK